ncbi:tetratricopeptide repeat protein [Spongiivirga sp. MCCC 1A20706]|uniref:tetratricopeptide repeat protein n=1 Tax=Spongiivirga sp. MCCC 1A20706 TaxID=3160963 RepID=UPI003977CA13
MKAKMSLVILGLFAMVQLTNAQANTDECRTTLSIFSEHYKVKNYKAAFEPWKKVYTECPDFHIATYAYGPKIVEYMIENEGSAAEKEGYKKLLMEVYENRMKYFASKTKIGDIKSKMGDAMMKHKMGAPDKVIAVYDEAFTKDRKNFKNPKSLYNYFDLYYKQHEAGKVSLEDLFTKYEELSEKFEEESKSLAGQLKTILQKEDAGTPLTSKEKRTKKRAETNVKAIGIFSGNLDALISAKASCENLVPLYQKNFDTNKTNAVWLRRAASRMVKKECTKDPMFFKLVESLTAVDPSAGTLRLAGKLAEEQKKYDNALEYYNQAVDMYEDSFDKAKIYLTIANLAKKRGQKSKARNYANKALAEDPSMGKAYLLIATLYGSSANQCGNSTFEKKSVYWLAADTARKAGRVDASLRSRANKLANSYDARVPSKSEIFNGGMAGKSLSIGCWIGRTIKVPNL